MILLVCILFLHVFYLLKSFIWGLIRVLFFSFYDIITNHSFEFPFITWKLLKIRSFCSYPINLLRIFLDWRSLLINVIRQWHFCLISIEKKSTYDWPKTSDSWRWLRNSFVWLLCLLWYCSQFTFHSKKTVLYFFINDSKLLIQRIIIYIFIIQSISKFFLNTN